ncbi:GNAT family N-acetyltransferase [Amycolatopsis jiangsuensis]|uniref:GNAT superfamily N-acetyltransferase n=1 Tax=Amycolatopsis jiangsuensis TaxID=1181879 RepID=A0A840J6F5_9PSEU|nr:GNAT family N-acetyltransferase [Amycolatopsis jiangsuensis]MBB4688987.1 GNAT superfamily N-acetyltransferase [Amycolatopsis jiangsuensis]
MELDELLGLAGTRLRPATLDDAAELLVLQRCCWMQEALLNDTMEIPALHEDLADVRESIGTWQGWVVRQGPRLIAAVRAREEDGAWEVGRLMVAPDLTGRGLGRFLLEYAERQAPAALRRFTLFTGAASKRNITMYERAGYRVTPQSAEADGHLQHAVYLVKDRAEG